MTAPTDETAVREYVLDAHRELLETVIVCADGVAESWDGEATTERQTVVGPFERALDSRGVTDRFPTVLVGVVETLGVELPARPVPAPPYVVVSTVGPVLRATLDAGRLVVTIRVFEVERGPTRYVRGPDTAADALTVSFKTR